MLLRLARPEACMVQHPDSSHLGNVCLSGWRGMGANGPVALPSATGSRTIDPEMSAVVVTSNKVSASPCPADPMRLALRTLFYENHIMRLSANGTWVRQHLPENSSPPNFLTELSKTPIYVWQHKYRTVPNASPG